MHDSWMMNELLIVDGRLMQMVLRSLLASKNGQVYSLPLYLRADTVNLRNVGFKVYFVHLYTIGIVHRQHPNIGT
jgi:hypothetical protein